LYETQSAFMLCSQSKWIESCTRCEWHSLWIVAVNRVLHPLRLAFSMNSSSESRVAPLVSGILYE
jgi:hypothetical protein